MKRTKRVKNAEIADVETWLTALENGKLSDFNIRDPHLLRAIGRAQTDLELVRKEGSVTRPRDFRKAEWNVIYAVSTALNKGETWYGVARTLGISSAEAKERFGAEVERLKVEREQIAEEQEMDAQQREDTEDQEDYDDGEYDDPYSVPFKDLSEEDKEAAGRLADAITAFEPVDTSQVREGGLITVTNKYNAKYQDRVLRVVMNVDGQLERVLLAGPPNQWISFSGSADWQVDAYEPPVYKKRQVGWATVETEEDVTERMFGMWINVQFSHEERLHFVSSENGRFYDPRSIQSFDAYPMVLPGPMEDFRVQGAKWLYEFGLMAQGVPEDARADWERISGKKFYLDRMAELIQLLKDMLS